MSEPNSLYIKLHIPEAKLEEALDTKASSQEVHTDWSDWLATQEWYGDTTAEEIIAAAQSEF